MSSSSGKVWLKRTNWIINSVLEKDESAFCGQAKFIDAAANPLYDFVNSCPIDTHATGSSNDTIGNWD